MPKPAASPTLAAAALEAADSGLPVLPLHSAEKGRCSCGDRGCKSPGKHPRTKHGLSEATTDEDQVKLWWKKWPKANIAVVGGTNLCLDIDVRSANGLESLEELVEDNGPLPDTAVAETGEYDGVRGRHYYFRIPEDYEREIRKKDGIRPGVDLRAARSYWILPPSIHHTGVRYEWIETGVSLEDRAEAPDWLLELAPEDVPPDTSYEPVPGYKVSKETRQFVKGELEVPIGEQSDFLVKVARSLWRTGRTLETVATMMWEGEDGGGGIQASDWDPDRAPWTYEDMYDVAAYIFAKAPTSGLEKDFDTESYDKDLGLAKRLVDSFEEGHVFHVEDWGRFYVWDTERGKFTEDRGYLMKKTLKSVVDELKRKASETTGDEAKYLFAEALEAQKRPRIEAALALAPMFCRRETDEPNADPFLLACQNGTLDLRTGELREADPKDLLTKRVRADYKPKAKSQAFQRFLKQVLPEKATRDYVQKAMGYSLTGSTREHKFFYVYGRPGSGKGTLVDTFAYLCGSYGASAQPETFMLKKNASSAQPSEDLARLAGARFVHCPEPERNSQFASAQLAQLTGQDPVVARFLHQNSFEFYPQFKLWMIANFPPRVGSTRSGVWRRMKVIPIDQEIKNPDTSLRDRVMRQPEVLEAFLAWAVEGAIRWYEENYQTGAELEDASEVEEATGSFYKDEDQVGRFLSDVVSKVHEQGTKEYRTMRVAKRHLFLVYEDWAKGQGIKMPRTIQKLGVDLKGEHGWTSKAARWDGAVSDCWMGVELREPYRKDQRRHLAA